MDILALAVMMMGAERGICGRIMDCYVIVTLEIGTQISMVEPHYLRVCQSGCCGFIRNFSVPREDTFHSLAGIENKKTLTALRKGPEASGAPRDYVLSHPRYSI